MHPLSAEHPGSIFLSGSARRGWARAEHVVYDLRARLAGSEVRCGGQRTLVITLIHGNSMKMRFEKSRDTNGFILSH